MLHLKNHHPDILQKSNCNEQSAKVRTQDRDQGKPEPSNRLKSDASTGNRKPILWDHFDQTDSGNAICKYCAKYLTMPRNDSTRNLWLHLNGDHPHLIENENG